MTGNKGAVISYIIPNGLNSVTVDIRRVADGGGNSRSQTIADGNGGAGSVAEGSGGGGGYVHAIEVNGNPGTPEMSAVKLEAMLLAANSGIISGNGESWICLGIVPQIDPYRNLWIRRASTAEE